MSNLQARLSKLAARQPYLFPPSSVPDHFRQAAVLILLWEEDGCPHTLLTVRAGHLSAFAGQVCFPGGRLDDGESFLEAALRETEEEVGIPRGAVEVVGRLDDAWSGGGYLMVPHVGFLSAPPNPVANDEVAKILTLRIDPDLQVIDDSREHRGITFTESAVMCDGERIFGLTADLLLEAVEMLQDVNSGRGAQRLQYLSLFAELPDEP